MDSRLGEAVVGRQDAVGEYREQVAASSAHQRTAYERRAPGQSIAKALIRERAQFVDGLLVDVWREHSAALPDDGTMGLVAVGGYGRGELHPGSDIDLLVVLRERLTLAAEDALREFVAFLWDIGLEISHSVRSVEQCVDDAREDVTFATTLMESRALAIDPALFQSMRDGLVPEKMWSSRSFFEAKWREQRHRHQRFNETEYNLEPNVKDGPGGLRDIQTVHWVAMRHFGADTLPELVTHGFLSPPEYRTLAAGQAFLWDVRFALHLIAGRREDRLLFQHQRHLAKAFGYTDDDANLAVEKFMKRYYRWITELSRLNEMLLELFQEAILYADAPQIVTAINTRFRAINGFLEAVDDQVFSRSPRALLELFLVLQQRPELQGVRASTIRLVRAHRHLIDAAFREDERAQRLFMEILRQPRGITHELRRMHRYGVLERYLPVFGAVVGQMQHDLFHAYTVDEHSLFVVSNLRAFAVPGREHEFPLCSTILRRLEKPELLYIAGLFHDIAKGRGGDHSELGSDYALGFCQQHHLSDYDARFVAWLVQHHLSMSITAQRRDISDPDIVNQFARLVGDQIHLDYLYLLTVADIRGTNPNLWNDWKDTLLIDLYFATERALRRGFDDPIDRSALIEEAKARAQELVGGDDDFVHRCRALWQSFGDTYVLRYAAEEIAWHARAILKPDGGADPEGAADAAGLPMVLIRQGRGGTEVFVYAPDQEYLFVASTAALERLNLTILDARIVTADNSMTLDTFVVSELDGDPVSAPHRIAEIRSGLRATLVNPGNAQAGHRHRMLRRGLRHFNTSTRVGGYVDPGSRRTVVEVIATDRPGLLARIGEVLSERGVRLQNAKIATFGERAEDFFFVADRANQPLDRRALDHLTEQIARALDVT